MKRGVWHFLTTLIVFSVLTTTTVAQTTKTSYDIFVPKGNTILSYLPISALKTVDSLTVSGILFEEDIEIIQKCVNLRYLDLSLAFTSESPEKLAEQQVLKEFVQHVVSLRESAGEEMYKNGDINASQYAGNKFAVDAAKSELSSIKITEANKDCYLPSGSFAKMKKLETVLLPLKACSVFPNCFSQCPNLKQVSLPPFISFIGRDAFSDCYQLKTIDFPLSLNKIERGAFDGTQIAYVDLHKCEWKNTDFEAFNSHVRALIGDEYVLAPPVKRTLLLPQGVQRVSLNISEGDCIYFPVSLTQMSGAMKNGIALFASHNPPKEGGIFNSTIFCPRGAKTKYYNRFGDSNLYMEVDDIYAVAPGGKLPMKPREEDKESLNMITDDGLEVELEDMPIIGLEDLMDRPDGEKECFEYRSEELSLKPSFLGGDINHFYQWVNSKLVYPEVAKEEGIQGLVRFSFIVNMDGRVTDVKIMSGVEESIDREVIRVISSSPRWQPGEVNNKAVQVRCIGYTVFRLQ